MLFCYPRNHVRKNPPSQQKVKSCSIFRSSTCYECVHFNKEDHLPQNGTLLTSPVFPSSQGSTAAHCFNLDRHLVIAFSTTPPNANLTHTCLCCTRSKTLSRTSIRDFRIFFFFCSKCVLTAKLQKWSLTCCTHEICFPTVCLYDHLTVES